MKSPFRQTIFLLIISVCLSCNDSKKTTTLMDQVNETPVAEATRYLYVASGACYSGSNTTFSNTTASNVVYRLDLTTAFKDITLVDYFSSLANAGDSPAGIVNIDSDAIYVLVENTTTAALRRVERVEKEEIGLRTTFNNNVTALSARLRGMKLLSNGDMLISKSTAIEYLTADSARVGAPFISASAAPCNSSITLIPKVITLANGKIVFLHAAAAQNRFGIFATTGGTTCSTNQAAPVATAYPTASFYDESNAKLFVAYAGNAITTDLNSIYVYSVNETTGAVSGATKIYDAALYPATYNYLLYGISEMAYDSVNSTVYIATSTSTATTVINYAIEKFTYDPTQIGVDNTRVFTRVGSSPFYRSGSDTKCISGMFVAD